MQIVNAPLTALVDDDYAVFVTTDRVDIEGHTRTVVTEVKVTFSHKPSSEALRRGINSGTLRRVEQTVRELTCKALEDDADTLDEYADKADALIAKLKKHTGQASPAWRSDLLNAHDFLKMAGDDRAIRTLSQKLGRNHGTLNNALTKARSERKQALKKAEEEGLLY